jgi:glycosyltransferase involved in cell wall biosynthesis
MRIGLFLTQIGRQCAGPETYEIGLLRSLLEIDRENEYHVFCLTDGARDAIRLQYENLNFHVLYPSNRWVSTLANLPISMIRAKVDLLHATMVAPLISPTEYVFTAHCFSNFAHPELYPWARRIPLNWNILHGVRRSRLTICVSEDVRVRMVDRFKIPLEKMQVVHNGVGENFRPIPKSEAAEIMLQKYGIRDPYILFVGQIKARKNVVRIIRAFAQLKREIKMPLKLLLAGRRIWTSDGVDEAIAEENLKDAVHELGHIGLDDLPVIYSGAELFVFPSLWEGFGIPVIEAMASGTPVVTSNISSLPEVAGDSAVLVDPYSVEEIAKGMYRILSDIAYRKSLCAKGLQRATLFSWTNTAKQTLKAYKSLPPKF